MLEKVLTQLISVLFVVTLVVFSIGLHKHRVAGKPFVFRAGASSADTGVTVVPAPLEDDSEKPISAKKAGEPNATSAV